MRPVRSYIFVTIKHVSGVVVTTDVHIIIPYIANCSRWKSCGFCRSIGNRKTFPVKYVACTIGFVHTRPPCNRECFPANYSLFLQPRNFCTLNDLQYTVHSYCDCKYNVIYIDYTLAIAYTINFS